MCGETYYSSQFDYIVYMASSGGLSVPESDQRQAYYNMSGIPDLYFDGYMHIVGAGSDARDGHLYFPIIEDHWTNTTPVAVSFPEFSFTPGNAYVTVKVEIIDGDLSSTANTYVRVALVEDEVVYSGTAYERVLRDMLPSATGTPLTAQHAGDTQEFTIPFSMGAWNAANMEAIAWVQRDSDKFIYNSGNTHMVPFAAGVAIDGPQQTITMGDQPLDFGDMTITNIGLQDDVYDITLDTSTLPAGWDAHFTMDGTEYTDVTVPLASFHSTNLFVTIDPSDASTGRVTLNVYSQGAATNVAAVDFVAVAGTNTVLLVADDGIDDYAVDYVGPAIGAAGRTFSVWDRNLSAVDATSLDYFDAVVWACGSTNPGLDATDRAAIDSYLAQGGKILITGQDVAQDLNAEGGAANLWLQFKTRCRYNSGVPSLSVNGVAGDAIGDGLSFAISGGDGANNQTDPDILEALTADAVPAFNYTSGQLAGIHIDLPNNKLVFLGFGLEAIADQANRTAVMNSSLTWLIGGTSTPVEDLAPRVLDLAQNQPNPFNPMTRIAFALTQRGPVRLEVFDLQGHLVRTLVNEAMEAGDHTVVWNGVTDSGAQAASGTYVYRLNADAQTLTRKMTLVK